MQTPYLSLSQLADRLLETPTDETTTQADIAYNPGGFKSTVAPVLKALAKKKKTWLVRPVADAKTNECKFIFGDREAGVTVPGKYIREFAKRAFGITEGERIPMDGFWTDLNEEEFGDDTNPTVMPDGDKSAKPPADQQAAGDEVSVDKALEQVDIELHNMIRNDPRINAGLEDLLQFRREFVGKFQLLETKGVAIHIADVVEEHIDVADLLRQIKQAAQGDMGLPQMIAEAIRNRSPLTQFEPFSKYPDALVGFGAQVNNNGHQFRYWLALKYDYVCSQHLVTTDPKILEELEAEPGCKVVAPKVFAVSDDGTWKFDVWKTLTKITAGPITGTAPVPQQPEAPVESRRHFNPFRRKLVD